MSTQPVSNKQIPLIERFNFDRDDEKITGPITALKKSYKELYRFSDFIAQDLTSKKKLSLNFLLLLQKVKIL